VRPSSTQQGFLDARFGARVHTGGGFVEDEYARALKLKDPSGKTVEYEADAIFVEKALTPSSDIVKDLVKLDERGQIVVDGTNRTNVPGVFAAGDVTNNFAEQVLIAVGEGAKAALSAYEYLLPVL
jgi:alkyl hydroperoxide reductase subunit AhpF